MNDNTGRMLTIRVVITDSKKAEWIWKNHLGNDAQDLGIKVEAIAEGDLFKENDMNSKAAEFFIREEGENTEEAISAHLNDGFDSPKEAAAVANKNVSPGARWDIVDRRGNIYSSGKNLK